MSCRTTLGPVRWRFAAAITTVIAGVVFGLKPAGAESKRVVLDNGVTVLMRPIPESDRVCVEAFYEVGFLHEPKGMTQAAHLLEHLVCNAGTKSFGQNEAMKRLNSLGMANAETLPAWTHYDYLMPADKLELAIQIGAERLAGLKIDKEIIATEASRCYRETDFVEQNPASGMTKHAFMAFNQAWRHGMKSALVRGGMEDFTKRDLGLFYRAFYRPDNLTLILVGRFEPDPAVELIEKHFGPIRPAGTDRPAAIDWSKIPQRTMVSWDARISGVCIAFPPPDDRTDRLVLSLLGTVLTQTLMTDKQISAQTNSVICSNFQWSVGELPFFVYATPKPGTNPEEIESLLSKRIQQIVANPPANAPAQIGMMATQLRQQVSMLDWTQIQEVAKMTARQTGQDEQTATVMVLGQTAINWGVADRLFGARPEESVGQLSSLAPHKLGGLLRRYLDSKKKFVTVLVPAETPAADQTRDPVL